MAVGSLAGLFEAVTRQIQDEREALNALDDQADGDAGDNMAENFSMITHALREAEQRQLPVDESLRYAGQFLREQGRGATAPIYANGLNEAAQDLQGKQGFSLDDLGGLLGGLLRGAEKAEGVQKEGGLLSALVPGITTFLAARKDGRSVLEALMHGYMASQRGAYQTSQATSGFGSFADQNTRGRVDPGAAGASSLLGGLLGSLLSGGLQSGRGESPGFGLDDLLGGGGLGQLFGGQGGFGWGTPPQTSQRGRSEPPAPIGPTEIV